MSPEQPQQGPGSIKVERTQTGVRIEKRILKVLKALAEYLDMSLGDLLEGIVLLAFEGKEPFSERLLGKIDEIKKVYELELTSEHAHKAHGPFPPDYLEVCAGAGEVSPFTYWSYQANRRSRKSF